MQATEASDYTLTIVPDAAAMSGMAAELVAGAVAANPGLVLAVPTGSTPLGMFEHLVAKVRAGNLDLSGITLFCLDEYVGVEPEDPNSLTGWLKRSFVDPAGIPWDRVRAVASSAADPGAAAAAYDAEIAAAGGLDLAVLGLGPNGHIAYNEPGSAADSRTRVLALTPESSAQAAAYWTAGVETPSRAITVGVGTLLESDRLVLIVSGAAKTEMLRRALEEPMDAAIPASWLRLAGDRLHVIADAAAASALTATNH